MKKQLHFDTNYGIDKRRGWSVVIDGVVVCQFKSLLVAIYYFLFWRLPFSVSNVDSIDEIETPTDTPPSVEPGYRILEKGEVVQPGDEFFNNIFWVIASCGYGDVEFKAPKTGIYRRRINQ